MPITVTAPRGTFTATGERQINIVNAADGGWGIGGRASTVADRVASGR
jgi:hypothetical protein